MKYSIEEKNLKESIIINILTFILTLAGCIIMFTGFKFMYGTGPALETTKFGVFKFFTVDSNVFMGIIALVFAIQEIKLKKGKIKEIKPIYYILKLIATTGVTLTFFVVFTYLGPISENGIYSMLLNSNLFFHLVIPVLSLFNFIIYERTTQTPFKYTFSGLLPSLLYAVFYLINILIHMKNGVVSMEYDWYCFVQNGVWTAIIVMPIMLIITYGISLALWKLNKRVEMPKQ